jgi:hypothetical protein
MGGIITTQKAENWLWGFDASNIYKFVQEGDFYKGTEKGLTSQINPIFNNASANIENANIKINTGASDPYQVAKVTQVNEKPFLNTLYPVYDGNKTMILPFNPWRKFRLFDNVMNGMQFTPQSNADKI